MKLYEYWLGLYPLDWEFCFMPVQTYKNFITEQYHKSPTFYNISAGSIEKVLAHIDKLTEHSVIISNADCLALLRKRGYIFKDALAAESG